MDAPESPRPPRPPRPPHEINWAKLYKDLIELDIWKFYVNGYDYLSPVDKHKKLQTNTYITPSTLKDVYTSLWPRHRWPVTWFMQKYSLGKISHRFLRWIESPPDFYDVECGKAVAQFFKQILAAPDAPPPQAKYNIEDVLAVITRKNPAHLVFVDFAAHHRAFYGLTQAYDGRRQAENFHVVAVAPPSTCFTGHGRAVAELPCVTLYYTAGGVAAAARAVCAGAAAATVAFVGAPPGRELSTKKTAISRGGVEYSMERDFVITIATNPLFYSNYKGLCPRMLYCIRNQFKKTQSMWLYECRKLLLAADGCAPRGDQVKYLIKLDMLNYCLTDAAAKKIREAGITAGDFARWLARGAAPRPAGRRLALSDVVTAPARRDPGPCRGRPAE